MDAINLAQKLSLISERNKPHIIAELNGQKVYLTKTDGRFIWHSHENEDEMFLVLNGKFTMHFRDRSVDLSQGEIIVVPRGVEHCPESHGEVDLMLFEPLTTVNTGNAVSDLTITELPRI